MKRILVLLIAVLITGCTTFLMHMDGPRLDNDLVTAIRPGHTTRQWVIDTFGTPVDISATGNSERMVFVRKEKKVPVYFGVIQNVAAAKTSTSRLEISIRDGIVVSYTFKNTQDD